MALTKEELHLIGGSDSAAIVGVHPYKKPIDVWRRVVEGHETPTTPPMRRGILMEPVIRQMFAEESGLKLLGPLSLRSPKHEWLRASLDDHAEVAGDKHVIEYKSANARVAHRFGDGPDDIPKEYACQIAFYLGTTGWNVAHLVALIGGDELRHYTILADPDLYNVLFEACDQFWKDYVLKKRPPPVDGSDSYSEWINERFTNRRDAFIQADGQTTGIALEYRAMCEMAKQYEEKAKKLRQQLEVIIGEASGLEGPFGRISFRRNKETIKVDWEGIVANMNVPDEVKNMYTSVRPGARVFRPTWSSK